MAEIQHLEREYAALPKPTAHLASPEERERILALAQDLPAIWRASTTTHAERKQLLRFLVKDVALAGKKTTVHIGIRWQTEALTELDIPRRKRACDLMRTDPAVVNRIRELAPRHPDSQIAELLNRENLMPGASSSFTESKVHWIRYAYDIPTGCPVRPSACPDGQRGDGRYSAQAAAELLNVNVSTIAAWCKSGRLDGIQAMPRSPWWIRLTPETINELRKPVRRRWSRRSTA